METIGKSYIKRTVKYFYLTVCVCIFTCAFSIYQVNSMQRAVTTSQTKPITGETIEPEKAKEENVSMQKIEETTAVEALPTDPETNSFIVSKETASQTQSNQKKEENQEEPVENTEYIEYIDEKNFPEDSDTAKLVKVATASENGLLYFGTDRQFLVAMNAPIGKTYRVYTKNEGSYEILVAAEQPTTGFFALIVREENIPDEIKESGNAANLSKTTRDQIIRIE